jgi:hypothetical protein
MRKLLVVLCAGLFVAMGGAQAYAGAGHGGTKAKKQCEAKCRAEYNDCKAEAGNNRNKLSKCDLQEHYCVKKC